MSAFAGILAAHVLTRLFPAKRLKEALLALFVLVFVWAYLRIRASVGWGENPAWLLGAIFSLDADSPLLPHFWAKEAATALLRGRGSGVLYPWLLLSNSAMLLMASLEAGRRLFEKNIERMAGAATVARPGAPVFPGKTWALLWKDYRVLLRDPGQWPQFLIIAALAVVYVYNFRLLPFRLFAEYVPLAREAAVLLNVLMAGLVLSAVSARFSYPSVSLEGRAFWVVRASPLGMKRFIAGKYIFGLLPAASITMAVYISSNAVVGAGGALMALSTLVVLVLCASVCGLGTGMGAMWPRFEYENIASVSVGLGGVSFMASAMLLVVATTMAAAWPYYLYASRGSVSWGIASSFAAAGIAINAGALVIPLRAGASRLEDAGEWKPPAD